MKPSHTSILLAISIGFAARPACAHPGHTRSARLIEVDLSAEPPTLKYGYVFEVSESEALRKLADADADGAVSAGEGRAAIDRMGAELRERLSVCRGANRSALACAKLGEDQLTGANSTSWDDRLDKPLSLVWEFRLHVSREDRALELRDASQRPGVDRTDALISPPKEARVIQVESHPTSHASIIPVFAWGADRTGELRRFAIHWEPPPQGWIVAMVAAGCALAALPLVALWKRRARRSTS